MEIYILRHGEADPHELGLPDKDRALTPKGKRDVRAVATLARRMKASPGAIFTSPLRRARETAAEAAAVFEGPQPTETDALLPDARPELLWQQIVHLGSHSKGTLEEILVAGHEPHMSRLTAFLLEAAVVVDFKKSAMVRISTPAKNGPPRGVLKWMITPAAAKRAK